MRWKTVLFGFVVIVALAGLGYTGWRYVEQRNAQSCKACTRPVHYHMKTVGVVDGRPSVYCCPACALSDHQQSGKPVVVVELTDYFTNSPLRPESSYVVRNSDVNPCLQLNPAVGESHQPLESHFDRCSPSVLAFQDQRSANSFANKHGGQVVTFSDFASALKQ